MRSLDEHRATWADKPILHEIYGDLHRRIQAACIPGATLEIGGGSGHVADFADGLVTLDIQWASWLSVVGDAHDLPFADASFANVTMLDVLHHLNRPARALAEMARILRPGGRVVMIEPGMTPVSRAFYGLFHDEPVIMAARPLEDRDQTGPRPEDANQAIPDLIFRRFRRVFEARCPQLAVVAVRRLSLFAYPLSGGFQPWQALPTAWARPLLKLEDILLPILGSVMAFRTMVVLERRAP